MKGKSAELLPHLQRLLTSYNDLDYGRQLNPVDAFFAFRLLLGRNPNLVEELPRLLTDKRTFREFLDELIHSDEFSHRRDFSRPIEYSWQNYKIFVYGLIRLIEKWG